MDLFAFLVIGLLIGAIVGAVAIYFYMQKVTKQYQTNREKLIQEYEAKIRSLQEQQTKAVEDARKESVDLSRSVLKGKMAEQMAPLLRGFDYIPADARFLGDPIDYVVFSGYTTVRDTGTKSDALEIVILDIKQGQSGLSSAQRAIAKAVEDGRMRFEVVRVFDDGTVKSHTWRSRRSSKLQGNDEGE